MLEDFVGEMLYLTIVFYEKIFKISRKIHTYTLV